MDNAQLLQEMEQGLAKILSNLTIPSEGEMVGPSTELEMALGQLENRLNEWLTKLNEVGSQTTSTQAELNETEKFLREQVKGFETLRKHLQS